MWTCVEECQVECQQRGQRGGRGAGAGVVGAGLLLHGGGRVDHHLGAVFGLLLVRHRGHVVLRLVLLHLLALASAAPLLLRVVGVLGLALLLLRLLVAVGLRRLQPAHHGVRELGLTQREQLHHRADAERGGLISGRDGLVVEPGRERAGLQVADDGLEVRADVVASGGVVQAEHPAQARVTAEVVALEVEGSGVVVEVVHEGLNGFLGDGLEDVGAEVEVEDVDGGLEHLGPHGEQLVVL